MLELDFNYNKARRLFSAMLARRDQWLRHLLQNDLAVMRFELELAWQDVVNSQLAKLSESLCETTLTQLLALAQEASIKLSPKNDKPSPLAVFQDWENGQVASLEHYRALCFLLLTKDAFRKTVNINQGFEVKSDAKEKMLELLCEFADDADLLALLIEIRDLPDPQFSDTDWSQLVALEAVLKSLAGLLQLGFRAAGECDHSEVTQRANLALAELEAPTDLGLRMDYHLQHILVDEFQDTSHGQIQLLKKLTAGWEADEGKTLFLVGDPMQSIYRFREADVSLFLQVTDNHNTGVFDNIAIQSLKLTQNFRSSQNLVSWFNDVYGKSFPRRSNVLTGAITYSFATCNAQESEDAIICKLVHNNEQEAQLLVDQAKEALQALPTEQDQVAILVRSRSSLKALLPALREAGVGYVGVDVLPLRELQAVIDALALCKAVCRELDRVSWLALLRGPWCGLTLSEMKLLKMQSNLPIWQQLSNADLSVLAGDAQLRVARFVEVMQSAISQHQQVSLGSLTRWAWLKLGGVDTLYGAARADVETVFELIEELQRGGDLSSMLDLEAALDGLYAQANSGDAQLVVSTIHKSKGLQYHTVILPCLSRMPRSDDKDVLMWAEHQNRQGESSLLLAPFTLQNNIGGHYQYLRQLESKRSANEAIRLMYVAGTRAEKRLILLASARTNEQTGEVRAPIKTSLLATVWKALEASFSFQTMAVEEQSVEPKLNQTLSRLPADYAPTFRPPIDWLVTPQINSELSRADLDVEYDWATNVATGVGIVLHEWLQHNDLDVLQMQVDERLKKLWRMELLALRVPEDRLNFAVQRLAKAVSNIQADTEAHFLFSDNPTAQNEYAISAYEQGAVKNYRIDRTFVDEQGRRWIVDYKSTDTNASDVVAFVDEQVAIRHRAQLERYGDLLEEIDRADHHEKRPIKLAVYFPLLKQLRVWDYKPPL